MTRPATTLRSTSPQQPDDVVGEWPDGGPDAVEAAASRASEAQRGWGALRAAERGRALAEAADRMASDASGLAELMVREVGKPRTEAAGEVARAVAILRYYAQLVLDADGDVYPSANGRGWLFTRRRPRGVAGLITPWNFPVAIPIWKAAPALAYGNTVVLKPATQALACGLRVASYFDLPEGVLEVVPVGGAGASRLAELPSVDALSFTGSSATGAVLAAAAARRGIAFQGEMGGSNASILLPDADLDAAAPVIASSAMAFAGQKCTATSRIIVVGDVDRACDAMVAAVERLGVGDPALEANVVGPVISEGAREAVLRAARAAEAAGGQVIAGGRALDEAGWYVKPTLVRDVPRDAELACEEVFGPVCAVLPARDADDAVALANATRYGLVASAFTRDLDQAMSVVERLDVGMTRVNASTTGVDYWAPFGGARESSVGPREQGRAARDFYTKTVTVTVEPSR
jgi:acyl-CoA reductase-like NAD-dependent aldehyde dehydrogenase